MKIFRYLRKKLLDQGKGYAYLKYALGEIILVVIGILVALGINNWHKGNLDSEKEKFYLKGIKSDLEKQVSRLQDGVVNEGIIKQTALDVLHHFEVHEGFVEMDSIFPKLNLLVIRLGMVDENITLDELITTGNIDLIKNELLRKEFISYYT